MHRLTSDWVGILVGDRLVQRECRIAAIGSITATQVCTHNPLTAGLAIIGSCMFTVIALGLFVAPLPRGLLTGVTVLCGATISLQIIFAIWLRQSVITCGSIGMIGILLGPMRNLAAEAA